MVLNQLNIMFSDRTDGWFCPWI